MMRRNKHGMLGGIALTIMGLGVAFTPQVSANGKGQNTEQCVREAAKDFQEEMKACDSHHSDAWERNHCKEMAREKFEHARHMCQMDKDNQGGGNQGGGNQGGGNQGGGNQGGGNQGGGNQGGGKQGGGGR